MPGSIPGCHTSGQAGHLLHVCRVRESPPGGWVWSRPGEGGGSPPKGAPDQGHICISDATTPGSNPPKSGVKTWWRKDPPVRWEANWLRCLRCLNYCLMACFCCVFARLLVCLWFWLAEQHDLHMLWCGWLKQIPGRHIPIPSQCQRCREAWKRTAVRYTWDRS